MSSVCVTMRFKCQLEETQKLTSWMKQVYQALKDKRFGVRLLKQLVQVQGMCLPPDLADQAAKNGNLAVLRWLTIEHPHIRCTNKAMDWAAEYGYLDVVTFLHLRRREFSILLTIHPDCVHRFGGSKDAMTMALVNGYYEIYYFLHLNRTEVCHVWTIDEMIRSHGDLEMIEIVSMERDEVDITSKTLMAAIDTNSLEIVQWLYANRRSQVLANFDALDYAQKMQKFEIANWISSRRT